MRQVNVVGEGVEVFAFLADIGFEHYELTEAGQDWTVELDDVSRTATLYDENGDVVEVFIFN